MPAKSRADRHFACHRRWRRRTCHGPVAVELETAEWFTAGLDADIEEVRKRREEMGT